DRIDRRRADGSGAGRRRRLAAQRRLCGTRGSDDHADRPRISTRSRGPGTPDTAPRQALPVRRLAVRRRCGGAAFRISPAERRREARRRLARAEILAEILAVASNATTIAWLLLWKERP